MRNTNGKYVLLLNLPYADAKKQKVDMFKYVKNDGLLNKFVEEQISDGVLSNIDIFKRDNNVLATENGYYIATYDENVKPVE